MSNPFLKIFIALLFIGLAITCSKDKSPTVGVTNKVELKTNPVVSIGSDSALSGGEIFSDGGDPITSRGVCWSTSSSPTISENSTTNGTGTGSYSSIMKNLKPNTTYFIRSYVINAQGTIYGNQLSFKTLPPKPTLQTLEASSINAFSVITGGFSISSQGFSISQKGVCWSNTKTEPTLNDNNIIAGTGTSNFSISINTLNANTIYYARAYATNAGGTGYGNTIQFRTLRFELATITTTGIQSVTPTTATGGGNITNDGGTEILQRGVCWNTSINPTIANSRSFNGTSTGSFTSNITGLQPGRTYYIRAYASNAAGTAYGQQITFSTPSFQSPSLSTSSINSITQSTAIGGGNITSDGGASVSERGLCWSTSANPTISNSRSFNGSGTGSFAAQMTGLQTSRTYYVRAYAINSVGTAYGQQVIFTTASFQLLALSTSSINSITQSTANGGGNISNDGGSTVIQRGICWSTSSNPTTSNSRTINGTGIGSFSSQMSGLLSNRTYYVRAYATTSIGTTYGQQVTFNTLNYQLPTVSTTSISSITRNSAQGGGNVTSDGGYTVIQRGVCWSTSTTLPTISNARTINGSGLGLFSSSITGLLSARTYYVRAYATNALGTSYGPTVSFMTNN